jgi:hypothetical protein
MKSSRIFTFTILLAALFILCSSLTVDAQNIVKVDWFKIQPGILKPKERSEITAVIQNTTPGLFKNIEVALNIPEGLSLCIGSISQSIDLRPMEIRRLVWQVSPIRAGAFRVELYLKSGSFSIADSLWLNAVDKRDPKHEFQTLNGAWAPYPDRSALQVDNNNKIEDFVTLPSGKLRNNKFGITAHLPRSSDEEDPFQASNLVDGDPATSWASRWWRVSVPFLPEVIQIDLGKKQVISEFRFIPSWMNGGVPAAFKIEVSGDARRWTIAADEPDFKIQEVKEGDPLRYGNLSWQRIIFSKTTARYIRMTVSRLRQGRTGFYCAPVEPFQLRIAEVSVLDGNGIPLDLKNRIPQVSSTFHAWYNTPEIINKTYPYIFKSGVKWNRIGQWGDKTSWDVVEKTKGVYAIDPEVDSAITESVKSGVNIIMGLNYGNNLYQKDNDPKDSVFGPTWQYGHPFLESAPTTEAAIKGFANYCRFMAKHFRGRVKAFEIWNEEDGWFCDSNYFGDNNNTVHLVKDYGRALAAAAKAIKEVNPEALIVFGGVAGSSLDYPRIALEQGAGPYIDIYAFHPYGHPAPEGVPDNFLTETKDKMEWKPRPVEISTYEEEITAYRELLNHYNSKMEIWADEMNWMAPGDPPMKEFQDNSELSQAKYLARFFTINASLNCGAIWWSLYNENYIQEWALMRSDNLSPRPAFYSASYVATVLDDAYAANDLKVKIVGDAPKNLIMKCFKNGRGGRLIGLWRTNVPDDGCKPEKVTLILPGEMVNSADLVDVLYGFKQNAKVINKEGGTMFPGLLVGDFPLFVRINK